MKRHILRVMALALTFTLTGCGAPANVSEETTDPLAIDPNATRIEAPNLDTSDDTTTTSGGTAAVTTKPAETTAPASTETRISFLAAGDNIIHENVYTDAKNRASGDEKYNFIDMYDGIADWVKAADLAFINQETMMGGDELGISGYPNFNSPQAAGEAIVQLGFDIVNIATNHMLDKKDAGLLGTIDFFESKPVTLLGGHKNKEDYQNIRVVECKGVKIAFLSYTYGLNGMTTNKGSEIYIPLIDQAEIVNMVNKAETLADCVIVVMHWGDENKFTVSNEQKTLASAISKAGADVILGMHSHTVQPVEWIDNADGSRTLCIYSLGNLISTMYNNYNMVGGIMTFDIVKDKDGVTIENPIYNPVITHYDKNRLGLQVYMYEDYTAELAAAHGTVYWGTEKRFSLDYINQLVKGVIDPRFLPEFMK
ncbi:MAG: CapA family protein [Clostridia bacterium]|nr:CapA family protein [Clostridia bacterium]